MGVDVVPASSDLRVGMIGSYGNRWANLAVGRCDFLLVLGSRLDIRQTGSETEAFRTGRTIFQVDCDPGEMNNRITGVTAILADLKTFAAAALPAARAAAVPDRSGWLDEIRGLREEWPDTDEMVGSDGINPNVLMHQLSARRWRRRGLRRRRRPAPDVGGPVAPAASRPALPDLGRAGLDGLRPAGGDRSVVRRGGPAGRPGGRRWRLPDQHPGAPDGRAQPAAAQDADREQPDPRHGPPVPAELLRQPVPVDGLGLQRAGLRRRGRGVRDPVERGRDAGRRRGGRVVADGRARARRCSR